MKSNVLIALHTIIEDNGEKEYNSTKMSGSLFKKNGRFVIIFEEDLDQQITVHHFITIQQEKVTIKRSGAISMNQKFLLNQRTENVYKHPHGSFNMETFTKNIKHEINQTTGSGRLTLSYTVKLNGQDERNHYLTLTYKKEDES